MNDNYRQPQNYRPSPLADMDNELFRVYQLVEELSKQLAHNQEFAANLQSQAGSLKSQAIHNGSGFVLRRFNTDLSKELFESELERMNAQIIIENQMLLHENKQLSLLLKEHESTMEIIMSKFRNYALAATEHELTLTRHYEGLLLARDTQSLGADLKKETEEGQSFHRLSLNLRALLRSLAGEDPAEPSTSNHSGEGSSEAASGAPIPSITDLEELLDSLVGEREDWAIERETEICRLEAENLALRQLLDIDAETIQKRGLKLDESRDLFVRRAGMSDARRGSGSSASGFAGGMIVSGSSPDPWSSRGNSLTFVDNQSTQQIQAGSAQSQLMVQMPVQQLSQQPQFQQQSNLPSQIPLPSQHQINSTRGLGHPQGLAAGQARRPALFNPRGGRGGAPAPPNVTTWTAGAGAVQIGNGDKPWQQ